MKPIDIDIITGKIKVDLDYYLKKEIVKTNFNINFFIDIKNDNYLLKSRFDVNDKNGTLKKGEILIQSKTTKELLRIEVKERKGKVIFSPIFKKISKNTILFIKTNYEWTIYFQKILYLISQELTNKVLPEKEEIYKKLKEEINNFKR